MTHLVSHHAVTRAWIPLAATALLASGVNATSLSAPSHSLLDLSSSTASASAPTVSVESELALQQSKAAAPATSASGSTVAADSDTALQQANAAEPAAIEGWKFQVIPYLWMMGIEGDGTLNGTDFDFEKSFDDLIEDVEFAGSIMLKAQYNRWVGSLQYDYADLSLDLDVPAGGTFDSTLNLLEAAVGYQIDGFSRGGTFDLMLGVRVVEIDNELDSAGPTISGSTSATDPFFMLRPTLPLFPSSIDGLRLSSSLAIGGGGDSDLIWELSPILEYNFSDTVAGRFGYRRVGWRIEEDNGNEVDIEFAGLVLGVSIGF